MLLIGARALAPEKAAGFATAGSLLYCDMCLALLHFRGVEFGAMGF